MSRAFIQYYRNDGYDHGAIDKLIDAYFYDWFKQYLDIPANRAKHLDALPILMLLIWGPSNKATSWPGVFINGYNFHTVQRGAGKATLNWGVCVRGSNSDDPSSSYYGLLKDVLVLEYNSSNATATVVLFDCDWFDPIQGMKVHQDYRLVDVHRNKMYQKYDPFVLAQQAIQVYYCDYPGASRDKANWLAVCETKSRRVVQIVDEDADDDAPYQSEEIVQPPAVTSNTDAIQLFDMAGINLTVDIGELRPIEEIDESEDEFDSAESTSCSDDEDNDCSYNPNEY